MVAEWKEFLWDVPEERIALWGHCQTLFVRYSFPALQVALLVTVFNQSCILVTCIFVDMILLSFGL